MKTTEFKVYQADCIEHGDRFIAEFKTVETNPDKLHKMGINIASGWGAECISVEETTNYKDIDKVYDADANGENR